MTDRNFNIAETTLLGGIVRFSLPLIWAVAVCWLSLTSSPPQVSGLFSWDKLQHAGAYALLAILLAQFLILFVNQYLRAALFSACLSIIYGGLMEVMQLMLQSGRTAEWGDLFADAVGAVLGAVVFCQACLFIMKYAANANSNHG
jgi:VanZ family protein